MPTEEKYTFDELLIHLKDKDSSIRFAAANALGVLGEPRAVEYLSGLNERFDYDEDITDAIDEALKKIERSKKT